MQIAIKPYPNIPVSGSPPQRSPYCCYYTNTDHPFAHGTRALPLPSTWSHWLARCATAACLHCRAPTRPFCPGQKMPGAAGTDSLPLLQLRFHFQLNNFPYNYLITNNLAVMGFNLPHIN